ncbi:MAG: hypothetical protein JXR84_01970 [Anaerolineae bacterium]|nr:hypothetical protein [Anaerolineae bacterium]
MTASTDDVWTEWPTSTTDEQQEEMIEISETSADALVGEVLVEPQAVTPDTITTGPTPPGAAFPFMAQAVMLKDMRSWAWWLVGFAVLHLFIGGINGIGWAWLLFMVAVGSFVFKDAVMYVLYTVTLAWAGISNLISGQSGWMFFSFLQFYMAYRTFSSYKRFQKLQDEIARIQIIEAAPAKRRWFVAPQIFPWLGGLLGIGSLGGLVLSFGILVVIGLMGAQQPSDTLFILALDIVVNGAVMGVAVSVGALLARYRYKAASIFGLISSILVLIIWLALVVFL